ncbi:hypothetical protein [Kitasatospora purpeofusca]|uniref:hypothetical protein n=1 Tax=Kitasatospora purpeofusca TaxID=67352 RepID=UPI0036971801
MTTLASRADAAHALMMLLAEHPTLPQPEFELHEYPTDNGEPDWGVCLVVGDSLSRFEQWRAALDLDPDLIDYSACSHGASLSAVGEIHGVSVELFAVPGPAK